MPESTSDTGARGGAILVATDFSASADEAMRQAHARANAQRATLIVCHVVPSLVRVNMLFPQRTTEQANAQLQLQSRALDMLVDRTRQITGREAADFIPVVDDGTPYSSIVEQAERAGAELIVVGDRGTSGLERVLLGSVAERVVRYAHCPVLIARAGVHASRILVATDLSDPSLPALAAAAREAERSHAHVTALHCIESSIPIVGPEYGIGFVPVLPPELTEQARARARERLAEAAQQVGLAADLRVVDGPPATMIEVTAEELDADLVVIGTRGRTGLRRVMLGSVAESVVRNAKSSVLVVRLAEDRSPTG